MKKYFVFLIATWSFITSYAQLNGDGYYRVQNYGTKRYAYLCDRTGSIDYTTQNADVGAIRLFKDINRAYDDPASILYVQSIGNGKYDIQAQGAGLYQIIGHYVEVQNTGNNNTYYVFATQAGLSKYLSDSRKNNNDEGVPSFNGNGVYRQWSIFAVNQTDNYLGITPQFSVNGKHYTTFYASFPFERVSEGMKFYYIKKVDNQFGIAVTEEITSDIIPGATPLIVECSGTTSAENKIMPVRGGGSNPNGNLLGGVYFCHERRVSPYAGTPFEPETMRTLAITTEGKIGFNNTPQNLKTVEVNYVKRQCLPANKAYLKVTAETPAELTIMNQAEYEEYVIAHSTVYATSITLDKTTAEITIGEQLTLSATVHPDNTTNKTVTWKSDAPNVATVENGVVKAISVGIANITATTGDGTNLSAVCKVTVKPILVSSIQLSQTSATLYPGNTLQLQATVLPQNATNQTIRWENSDPSVLSVDNNGLIKAIMPGEAVVTVSATDGSNVSAQCSIKVNPILAQSITLNQTEEKLTVGDRLQLIATILPEDVTNKQIRWTTGNESIATVSDEGIVIVTGAGETVITAFTTDGTNLSAQCHITAEPATVFAESISLNIQEGEVYIGRPIQLVATILPTDVSTKGASWTTSNPDVATVNEIGVVNGIAEGEAIITATTVDGTNLSASCKLTIKPVIAETITLNITEARVEVGKTLQLSASITPDDTTIPDVKWQSSDESIATVNDGLVTANSEGEVIITATTTDGSNLSVSCAITVFLADGIQDIHTPNNQSQVFSIDGRQMNVPRKGLNIIKTKDGKIIKLIR